MFVECVRGSACPKDELLELQQLVCSLAGTDIMQDGWVVAKGKIYVVQRFNRQGTLSFLTLDEVKEHITQYYMDEEFRKKHWQHKQQHNSGEL